MIDRLIQRLAQCLERLDTTISKATFTKEDLEARDAARSDLAKFEELPILDMLELSTAHISENTARLLENNECKDLILSAWMEYGWIIYTNSTLTTDVPEDLARVLRYAHGLGISYVKIDRDGEVLESLPTYEW